MNLLAVKDPGFFEKNGVGFDLLGGQSHGKGLRECQLGAYWSVMSHFTVSNMPALVSLPTGSGKTALMMALAFGLKVRRVLIVSPVIVLRDQVSHSFASLEVLKRCGVLLPDCPQPAVVSNDDVMGSIEEWTKLKKYDVVSATPKTVSPLEHGVCPPIPDLFDLVMIDEAHHAIAPTWVSILKAFKSSRCVLLTATPFRRDKQRLPAPMVYHYPIQRALDNGIYEPVEYIPVDADPSAAKSDPALCKTARDLLRKEKDAGREPRLLIRSGRVNHASSLKALYENEGVKIDVVDYTKTWSENKAVIDSVRTGSLDGMVCVGMVGEGLDLPQLKIAVLHDAPRSLPFTLQFIGRVSRPSGGEKAYLLAVPDTVTGEMRRLYHSNPDWRSLVPKLVETAIKRQPTFESFTSFYSSEKLDLDPVDIHPFFSVRTYIPENPLSTGIDLNMATGDDLDLCLQAHYIDTDCAVFITERQAEPPWAADTPLLEKRLDLHVYYYVRSVNILFESTTSKSVARSLRKALFQNRLDVADSSRVIQSIGKPQGTDYIMIGLKNAAGSSPSAPTYKTLMGRYVQAAVRPSDGRRFAPGHALMRWSSDEMRGIAPDQGRIWAIMRNDLLSFRQWCSKIAQEMGSGKPSVFLPDLRFLASPHRVGTIAERPLAAFLSPSMSVASVRLYETGVSPVVGDTVPVLEVIGYNKGVVTCLFCAHSSSAGIPIAFDNGLWSYQGTGSATITIDEGQDSFQGDLTDYLNENQPRFYMPSGYSVVGQTAWRPSERPGQPPSECFEPIDWTGCDITVEQDLVNLPLRNVLDWIQSRWVQNTSGSAIIVKDHKRGEIADFIIVEPDNRIILICHCKASKGKKPSDRVEDVYEVFGQACRSTSWVKWPRLLDELYERIRGPRKSTLVKGSLSSLSGLRKSFRSNEWSYLVVVAQPGLNTSSIASSPKIGTVISSAYEWIVNVDAGLRIWGQSVT